ncbi:alpha-crystallin B chain-like [Lampetra planeri]
MDIDIQHPWLRHPFGSPLFFPARVFDQHFGEGLLPRDACALPGTLGSIFSPLYWREPGWPATRSDVPPASGGADGSKDNPEARLRSGLSEMRLDEDQFAVHLDVKHFAPEELGVKVVDDFIEVYAKHEERQDEHGFISREFRRRYRLPTSADAGAVAAALSPDGVLSVRAPLHPPSAAPAERAVTITRSAKSPAVIGSDD